VTGGLRTGEKGFLRSLRQRCELRRFLIVFPSIGLMPNEKPHYAQKRDKPLRQFSLMMLSCAKILISIFGNKQADVGK
jgi:hypothetical protein